MNHPPRWLLRARTTVAAAAALAVAQLVAGQRRASDLRQPAITPATAAYRLDPNRASADELMLLPGIGPVIANNIVAYRDEQPSPAFRRPADLDRVTRIGPTTIERLRPLLSFPDDRSAATGAAAHTAGSAP